MYLVKCTCTVLPRRAGMGYCHADWYFEVLLKGDEEVCMNTTSDVLFIPLDSRRCYIYALQGVGRRIVTVLVMSIAVGKRSLVLDSVS